MRPEKVKKLVAARVRALRKEQGLNGAQVANLLGKSASWVSDFERGQYNSTLETISQFAELLGLDELDLFTHPELNIRHVVVDLTRDASMDTLLEVRDLLTRRRHEARNKEEKKQRLLARAKGA